MNLPNSIRDAISKARIPIVYGGTPTQLLSAADELEDVAKKIRRLVEYPFPPGQRVTPPNDRPAVAVTKTGRGEPVLTLASPTQAIKLETCPIES